MLICGTVVLVVSWAMSLITPAQVKTKQDCFCDLNQTRVLPSFNSSGVVDARRTDGTETSQERFISSDGLSVVQMFESYSTPASAKLAFETVAKDDSAKKILLRATADSESTYNRVIRIASAPTGTEWEIVTLQDNELQFMRSKSLCHLLLFAQFHR